ncbi:hypothetical protein HMPREF3190_00141 [Umbribacter vaginalis]|nr:hypothetical protein HMPREF3190_00141 [Coriobacteriales bacterium DNF00809]
MSACAVGGRFAMRFGFVWVRVGACGEESLPILYGWRELLVRQFFFECTLWIVGALFNDRSELSLKSLRWIISVK